MKKRVFMFFLIAIFIVAMGYSAMITVTNPRYKSCLEKGKSYNITWTTIGLPISAKLKINIFKESIKPENFKLQLTTDNKGLIHWVIPAGFETGIYYIRIKAANNSAYGDSAAFKIQDICEITKSMAVQKKTKIKKRMPFLTFNDLAVTKIVLTARKPIIMKHRRRYIRLTFKGTVKNVGKYDFIDRSGKSWAYLYLTTMWRDYPEEEFKLYSLKRNKTEVFTHSFLYPVDGFKINDGIYYKGVELSLEVLMDKNKSNNQKKFYWKEVKNLISELLRSNLLVSVIKK